MKKYSRLIISLVLIMSLVITAVPKISFADSGVDFPGNPSKGEYDHKNEGYNDSDWYFDEKGNPTNDTNSIYWIKFRVSDNRYLSFESNNVYIERINVKGGNQGYRVYDDLGYSGTNLRAPEMDNNGKIIIPEISHYSFKIRIDEPDPPWEGTIKVIKTFIDSEGREINPIEGVSFTLTGPDYNETLSYDVDEEAIMFTGLYEGIYFLTENTPDGYTSSLGDGIEINLLPENTIDNLYKVEVTNTKESEEPPAPDKGILILRKVVEDHNGTPIDDNEKFTFAIYKLDDIMPSSLNDDSDYENGAPEGIYYLYGNDEVEIELDYGRYVVVEINVPEDYTPKTEYIEVLIDKEDQVAVFINVKEPTDTPTPRGSITVKKIVLDRREHIIENNRTRFYFDLFKKLEDGTWDSQGRITIIGNGTDIFTELEDGEYRVREVNIDNDYRLISDNDVKVIVSEGSSEEVEFTNKLRPISPPEKPEEPEDPEPEKPDKPEKPKDPEPEKPQPEPDPEPEPEPQPEPEPEPELDPDEEVVIEEPVPEAKPTLPKTGVTSPIIYSGLGTLLLGFGLFLKKKND